MKAIVPLFEEWDVMLALEVFRTMNFGVQCIVVTIGEEAPYELALQGLVVAPCVCLGQIHCNKTRLIRKLLTLYVQGDPQGGGHYLE